MTKRKNKNTSKKIPQGTLIHSRDDYFFGTDYQSQKSRMAVVLETNKNDEMALSKLTTSPRKSKSLPNFRQGNSRYNYENIYISDDEGNPITLNVVDSSGKKKFVKNRNPSKKVSKKDVNIIKKDVLFTSKYKKRNRYLFQKLKGRKK